jgi:flavodoxin
MSRTCGEVDKMKKDTKKETKKSAAKKQGKTLVVFYSRTGTTKKVAQGIAGLMRCDVEELVDKNDRKGVIGYLSGGKDATKKATTDLQPVSKDPSRYGLVIIGTPVWSWNVTPAVRTYLRSHAGKFKSVAFFCTMAGNGSERTFESMEAECGKKPKSTLALLTREVVDGTSTEKIKAFTASLNALKLHQSRTGVIRSVKSSPLKRATRATQGEHAACL